MKLPKLKVHQPNFSPEELVINPKDFPDIDIGDVVEIYHEEEAYSRLLLQVKSLDESIQQNTVSVLHSIATGFNLTKYHAVNVNRVAPKDVSLDLVELVFKEQYLSRSDMWRHRKSFLNSVVYINKTVRFADIRATVDELWSKGDRVTCGFITNDTRVTYRSATAQVNIFIQLSSEMWDFDNYGDLYFEKTVQGYLVDLFGRWKEKNCNHDVTITMFSRTFYDAISIEDFPKYMRECVRADYKARFYEDFYRVVVQNERYDDWTKTIIQLRTIFNQYTDTVLNYHHRSGDKIPKARNSTAAEGNFLEVLNMGLNIYEKFYLDRNFDRTGKLSLVITPGAGVFEVDRELTFITKQRTIDIGNSCDLVCMGEQPLHVVPLLKFHSTNPSHSTDVGDDYNIPHWINHSFYTSENQEAHMMKNKFMPRIRAPIIIDDDIERTPDGSESAFSEQASPYLESEDVPFVDYDAYDAEVFNLSSFRTHAHITSDVEGMRRSKTTGSEQPWHKWRKQKVQYTSSMSRELQALGIAIAHVRDTSAPVDFMSSSYHTQQKDIDSEADYGRKVVGSCGHPANHRSSHSLHNYRPSRALINPFAPSRLHFKVTSNRRRWAHAFPTNTDGASVQPHHQRSCSSMTYDSHSDRPSPPLKPGVRTALEMRRQRSSKYSDSDIDELSAPPTRTKNVSVTVSTSSDSGGEGPLGRETQVTFKQGIMKAPSHTILQPQESVPMLSSSVAADREYPSCGSLGGRSRNTSVHLLYSRSSSFHKDLNDLGWEHDHNWMFGVTGEQEWTPEVQTGMDWKSMMRPASLPITTDYFPDRQSLNDGFYFNPYSIIPEHCSMDIDTERRKPLSTREVYNELIHQRIAQGFQIVLHDKPITILAETGSNMSPNPYQGTLLRRQKSNDQQEVILSIGRIFHHLKLDGDEITVKRIWPKHPYPQKSYHYTYRFQVPDSQAYDVSWTEFRNEKLEHYNWNYVDQYICTRGEDDNFQLTESMKYWRARFFLLPCNSPATKRIIEGSNRCDLYEDRTEADEKHLIDGFLRFIESINKIRRPPRSVFPRSSEPPKRRVSLPVSPMAGSIIRPDKALNKHGSDMAESPHFYFGSPNPSHMRGETASPVQPIMECKPPFKLDSLHTDMVDAMLDPSDGLHFLNDKEDKLLSLPSNCFIAGEAVKWLLRKVDGATHDNVLALLQDFLKERLIRHALGDPHANSVFCNGFVLYCISYDKSKKDAQPQFMDSFMYTNTNEWCEVITHESPSDWSTKHRAFLLPQLPNSNVTNGDEVKHSRNITHSNYSEKAEMKSAYVDVDSGSRSDRTEWGSSRYHVNYYPQAAFELELQWLVSTGCILGELVSQWSRKAGQNGFHFLPVPGDPFALPFTPNSDPLRGPIFVPLNVECLKDRPDSELFEDYPKESREERLLLFQHSVLKRFGFMPDQFKAEKFYPSIKDAAPPTYVHQSGGMFAMIPDCQSQKLHLSDLSQSQHIATDHNASAKYYKAGFLWSWNFLLTKKWRSSHTGDEFYQDKMLVDFRAFCNNNENRLRDYFDESRAAFLRFGLEDEHHDLISGDIMDTTAGGLLINNDILEGD